MANPNAQLQAVIAQYAHMTAPSQLTFLAFALLALSACAHSTTQPASMPAKETAAMNTTNPDSAGNYRPHTLGEFAELTPEEVGRRFLNLIESLKSFDELSSDRVREVTQLPMVIPPSDTDDGFLTMSLPESGWQYSFSYSINAQYPRYTNAAIEFSNIKDDRADMAAVCGIDFNAYVSELKRMGFLEREDMAQYDTVPPLPVYIDGDVNGRIEWSQAQFRRIPTYFFSRGNVIVSIRQQREADAPDAKLYHACVESIGISRAGG